MHDPKMIGLIDTRTKHLAEIGGDMNLVGIEISVIARFFILCCVLQLVAELMEGTDHLVCLEHMIGRWNLVLVPVIVQSLLPA